MLAVDLRDRLSSKLTHIVLFAESVYFDMIVLPPINLPG